MISFISLSNSRIKSNIYLIYEQENGFGVRTFFQSKSDK